MCICSQKIDLHVQESDINNNGTIFLSAYNMNKLKLSEDGIVTIERNTICRVKLDNNCSDKNIIMGRDVLNNLCVFPNGVVSVYPHQHIENGKNVTVSMIVSFIRDESTG